MVEPEAIYCIIFAPDKCHSGDSDPTRLSKCCDGKKFRWQAVACQHVFPFTEATNPDKNITIYVMGWKNTV